MMRPATTILLLQASLVSAACTTGDGGAAVDVVCEEGDISGLACEFDADLGCLEPASACKRAASASDQRSRAPAASKASTGTLAAGELG